MHCYEIEIKSLLGTKEKAHELLQRMKSHGGFQKLGSYKQLNHYFVGGSISALFQQLSPHLLEDKKVELEKIIERARDFSVRTRWTDGKVMFVLKAAIDNTTSSNGIARMEFEANLTSLSLDELDKLVLNAGFTYQAKWSRERSEYKYKDAKVSIDKNAGYGYLAEFEIVETDPAKVKASKQALRDLMKSLGVEELPQDRLERMFAYYNNHWQEYYGTDKVFTVK